MLLINEMVSNTIGWKCIVGTNKGYDLSLQKRISIDDFSALCMRLAKKIYEDTNVYISMAVSESRILYNEEWGCPQGGEYTYTISGCCNTEFSPKEEYLNALDIFVKELKKELEQSTVLLEITPVHIQYYK